MQSEFRANVFWSENWRILVQCNVLGDIFPCQAKPFSTNLNAIVRLSVYVASILRLLGMSPWGLTVPVIAFVVTYLVFQYNVRRSNESHKEAFTLFEDAVQHNKHPNASDTLQHEFPPSAYTRMNTVGTPTHPETTHPRVHSQCTSPTQSNPFGNTLITEMQQPRQIACQEKDDVNHKKKIETQFLSSLTASQSDVYNKHASQRQFFTMPWTTGAPDLDGDFGHWLYDSPPNAKENDLLFRPM